MAFNFFILLFDKFKFSNLSKLVLSPKHSISDILLKLRFKSIKLLNFISLN